jgi:hypothetical protein
MIYNLLCHEKSETSKDILNLAESGARISIENIFERKELYPHQLLWMIKFFLLSFH